MPLLRRTKVHKRDTMTLKTFEKTRLDSRAVASCLFVKSLAIYSIQQQCCRQQRSSTRIGNESRPDKIRPTASVFLQDAPRLRWGLIPPLDFPFHWIREHGFIQSQEDRLVIPVIHLTSNNNQQTQANCRCAVPLAIISAMHTPPSP